MLLETLKRVGLDEIAAERVMVQKVQKSAPVVRTLLRAVAGALAGV
jgi:hypothetical protein